MNKPSITLEEAFNSTFHEKFQFNDFLNLKVDDEYETFQIKKRNILNPNKKFKRYLKFLNSFIFKYTQINESVVHSYIREKNTYTAIIRHAKNKYFFKTDIQNFFNSITVDDINRILDNSTNTIPISDIDQYKALIVSMVTVDKILPVGFSTSPNISNACLSEFDNDLDKYCQDNHLIYTRYSDDIIISGNNFDAIKSIEEIIEEILKTYYGDRFSLNKIKTKHTHKGNKIKLLGMTILPSGRVSIDNKIKKQLEILFHFYINDKIKFNDYLDNKYEGSATKISGQLNYINAIDKDYLIKLRKKYGNFVIDYFSGAAGK